MSSQLGEAFVPIRATLDKLDADLAGARKKIEGATGKLSQIGNKMGSFLWKGAIMGAEALAVAIAATAVASVVAAGKFQSSMAIMSTAVDPVAVGASTAAEAMDVLGDAAIEV
ncbi:MAG: hypothetical protein HUU38_28865, partial [Anaerolineales bacterium]|nr:hypothetical protein [Anaerolineales bacterium]